MTGTGTAAPQPEHRWVEIRVEAERDAVDDVVGLLGRYCTGGAVVENVPWDDARRAVVKGFVPEWDEETHRKLEIALLLLSRSAAISEPRITLLAPEDWTESWKQYFSPQHIGRHTVIVPTWHAYDPAPGEVIIHLDPGMAFGTGLHASTRLCLIAIEQHLQPGMRVLDVGTGSGILSIAAALQGAAEIDAIDIDAVSVRVAADNAALNGVQDRIHVARGTVGGAGHHDVPRHAGRDYDLVLANILAEVIVELAPGLSAALRPGGTFIGSGIISERAETVEDALRAVGLAPVAREHEGDWVALVARKGA